MLDKERQPTDLLGFPKKKRRGKRGTRLSSLGSVDGVDDVGGSGSSLEGTISMDDTTATLTASAFAVRLATMNRKPANAVPSPTQEASTNEQALHAALTVMEEGMSQDMEEEAPVLTVAAASMEECSDDPVSVGSNIRAGSVSVGFMAHWFERFSSV